MRRIRGTRTSATVFVRSMVATYGEDAVANMTDGLSERIRCGEFTVNRVTQ